MRRPTARRVAAVFLAGIILLVVAKTVDLQGVRESLSRLDATTLLLVSLLYLPSWWLRGERWRGLAGDLGDKIERVPACGMATVGNMLNLVLPAKTGDLLWTHAAHQRWGIPYGRGLVGVLAGRILDLLVLAGMGLLGGLFLAGLATWKLVAAGLALVICTRLGVDLFIRRQALRALLRGPTRALLGLHDLLITPMRVLVDSRRMGRHFVLTIAIWLIEGAVAWCLAQAMGLSLSPAAVLFWIMAANLSKILPLTPASMGTYEAAGAIALGFAGVDYTLAFSVVLAEHLLKNGVNLVLGALALLLMDIPVLSADLSELSRTWSELREGPSL